ncbi:MAG: hypothetical protein ABIT96_09405 [Ferruginibacter sp.]
MKEDLPIYIYLLFVFTTALCFVLLIYAIKKARRSRTRKLANTVVAALLAWLAIQAALTISKIYSRNLESLPPKMLLLGVIPPLLFIVLVFSTAGGRKFVDRLPLKYITWIHVVRVPVEITLYMLMIYKAVPVIMTFEGRNYDILAGLTAPLIVYFGHTVHKLSRRIILLWNIICLGLLVNIVILAVLSAPFPFQQFSIGRPNIAVLNFPFSWLPVFIVPVVLFAHLVSIRQALVAKKIKTE